MPHSAPPPPPPRGPLAHLLAEGGRAADWFFGLPTSVKRPVLFLLATLIIFFPTLLYNMATDSAYEAAKWVSHSREVKAKVYETLFHLRDGEAAARTQLIAPRAQSGIDFEEAMGKLDGDLAELRRLTLDNSSQQERIGLLRASLDGRNRTLHAALKLFQQGKRSLASDQIADGIANFPFRETAQAMIDEEERLLGHRLAEVRHRRAVASAILFGSAFAQLLLCLTIYLVSEKDARLRRSAEERSAEAAAQAQSIVETTPDPLAVLDHNGRIVSLNKAFTAFYDVPAQASAGRFLHEVADGAWDDAQLRQRILDLIPRQREIWDLEVSQTVRGESRVMLVNARPFPGAGGRKLILLSAKDLTARKKSEEQIHALNRELNARVDQAQAVNQELEAFSYSVSHDLRAPLRHITGFADMLNSHVGDGGDPKTRRYLKYILESADQMGTLIDDLLVFSRMGRTEMVNEEVDMNAMVRDVIKHFSVEVEGRRVDFEVAPLPSCRGDAAMLRLVWMNLIGNSIKYSRTRPEARIEIGSKAGEGPETIYFVRDNGVGFNMKYVHKLFGVFQRLHQSDEYEGTGIGLANVRRIVQRHGGKVWAQGYVDQGATFYFSLPPEPLPQRTGNPEPLPVPQGHLNQLARLKN